MSQMFLFYFIFYGGAMVFLGGAGAPASPSLAPPMPKGILGWASGAERIERAERNLQKALSALKEIWPLRSPLRSHALVDGDKINTGVNLCTKLRNPMYIALQT